MKTDNKITATSISSSAVAGNAKGKDTPSPLVDGFSNNDALFESSMMSGQNKAPTPTANNASNCTPRKANKPAMSAPSAASAPSLVSFQGLQKNRKTNPGGGGGGNNDGKDDDDELDPLKLVELRLRAQSIAQPQPADLEISSMVPAAKSEKPSTKEENEGDEDDVVDLLKIVEARAREADTMLQEGLDPTHLEAERLENKILANSKKSSNDNGDAAGAVAAATVPPPPRGQNVVREVLPGAQSVAGRGGTLPPPPPPPHPRQEQSFMQELSQELCQAIAIDTDLEKASPVDLAELQKRERSRKKERNFRIATLGWLLLAAALILGLVFGLNKKDEEDPSPVKTPSISPTTGPSMAPTVVRESYILSTLPNHTIKSLEDEDSAQFQAFMWLLRDPFVYEYQYWRILQRHSLMTFFYATSGPTNWTNNEGWGDYNLHECEWFQMKEFGLKTFIAQNFPGYLSGFLEPLPDKKCDEEGRYQHLWLSLNGLVGTLPEQIFSLTFLKTLSFDYNQLFGSIPTSLGRLSDLQGLSSFTTGLSGSLPKEIGHLSSLQILNLIHNKLEDWIPDEIWQLTNLESLCLTNNTNLKGTIPSLVGHFSKLRHLTVGHCDLSGTLPSELGKAASLDWLVVRDSRFSGTIPTEIGNLSKLGTLSLWGNQFSGKIPSELGLLSSSYAWYLYQNLLTGGIPSQVARLTSISIMWLHSNQLTGTIPREMHNFSNLEFLALNDNSLTGTIPSELGLLTALRLLSLANNSLSGTVPLSLSSLKSSLLAFRIDGNPLLSGQVPDSLCALNDTCIHRQSEIGWVDCERFLPFGSSFDCTELLSGCDCPR